MNARQNGPRDDPDGLAIEPNPPEIDVFITDETRREFQGRGSLRTIPTEEGSDAVLKGIIHAVDVQPSAVTADRIATSYVIIVRASVELKETRAGGEVGGD